MGERPRIISSVAMSLDGCIDDTRAERLLLSNEQDLHAVHELRARQDAILVGSGTLRADNPKLLITSDDLREKRVRLGLPPDLLKVTVTRSGELSPQLRFFTMGAGDKIVYCPEHLAEKLKNELRGLATIASFSGDSVSPDYLLNDLHQRGVRNLMIEGGMAIHTQFLQAGLVDELRIAIAPRFVGETTAPRFVDRGKLPSDAMSGMHLISLEKLGDMAILHFRREDSGTQR